MNCGRGIESSMQNQNQILILIENSIENRSSS